MNAVPPFMNHHKLMISTLSPVHMGCAEDYEPTNYVLDEDVLYAFDTIGLASILTGDEHRRLATLVKQPGELLSMQQFIYGLRDRIAGIASHTVVVAPAVAEKYHNSIGRVVQRERSGRGAINKLGINRTAFNPHDQRPVLPGSGIKGAIRTAVLNALNDKKKQKFDKNRAKYCETQLLGGSFSEDPLRLIKISDASWREQEGNPGVRIAFDNNLPKNPANLSKERKGSNLSVMREILPGMTARAFTAQMSLQNMGNLLGYRRGKISSPQTAFDIDTVVRNCNRFYGNLLADELKILKRLNCLDKTWLGFIEELMDNELGTLLDSGGAMLLRVGRHCGAEGVTIEGTRSIKINLGEGKREYLDHATTLWLAGEQEKSKHNLQPFGWLLVEVDPQPGNRVSDFIFTKLQKFNEAWWKKS